MSTAVLLNNVDHHDLGVITGHSAQFGDSVNETTVFPTEYEELQREYPILFRRDPEGVYRSVALLGFDRDENLFLGEAGWTGRYVPALLQRGPFSIGVPQRGPNGEMLGEPLIHVDLDHPRVTRGGGMPAFLAKGGNSPYLEHIAGVLRRIFTGVEATKPMFAAFEEYGLIEAINVEIRLSGGRTLVVPDCFSINQERLLHLDGDGLAALHRTGFLRAAIWAVSSLGNIGRLIDLKNAREWQG